MAWGLGLIDQDGKEIGAASTSESESESSVVVSSTVVDVYRYNGQDVCVLKDVIKCYRDQFKGCLDPKKAIEKKNIFPCYRVVSRKKQWVPCAADERKAKILVPMSWVRANILGFFQ
jgi:hypothetical protein